MAINPRTGRGRTNWLIVVRVFLRLLKSYARFCLVVFYMAVSRTKTILTGESIDPRTALSFCVSYLPKLVGRFWSQYRHCQTDSTAACVWLVPNPSNATPATGKDVGLKYAKAHASVPAHRFEVYRVGAQAECLAFIQKVIDANPWVLKRLKYSATHITFGETKPRCRVATIRSIGQAGAPPIDSEAALKFYIVRTSDPKVYDVAIWKNHFVLDFGISYKLVQGVPMLFTEGHSLLVQPLEWADVRALGRGVTYYYRFQLPARTPGGPTPTRALARTLVYNEGFDVVKVLKPVHLRTAENPIPFFYFVRDDTEKDGLRQCMKVPPERRVGRDPREVMLNSWFNFESSPPCRGYQYNQDGGSDAPVVHVLTRSSRSGEHSQYIYTQGFCLYSLKLVLREDGNLMRLRGRGYFELDQQPAELDSPPAVDNHRDVESDRSLVQVARDNWKRAHCNEFALPQLDDDDEVERLPLFYRGASWTNNSDSVNFGSRA
mmetsp:Transcript_75946/g.216639  ORF Transcript_75946/g.216639 Transcript_75946/m.216639 type:complete len:490 (+) Transcript_75946:951-2420(+)|eukprot:CAMPEP_0119471530 /NCGR_PEP_ID=MMETSP1344-20130328/3951_1 /TAXON_ID=236787 /ORGANISM="Florenciella parvula, Strain CCMP2471" /LENGTH=489 /DNA_ID=CAMNT_0007504325 /DNA_START=262 /DNA_END=1731 /DNA_ORIENTATION=+